MRILDNWSIYADFNKRSSKVSIGERNGNKKREKLTEKKLLGGSEELIRRDRKKPNLTIEANVKTMIPK